MRAFVGIVLMSAPAWADITLDSPVDCTLGETCFIQQFVDRDAGPGAVDFMGRGRSYDGHKGTDFRVVTDRDMAAGVNVLAAAPGRVRGVRDGMADVRVTDANRASINGRECGNGVVIDHGNGWETQYCHLLRDSIAVRQGQAVRAGAVLGKIGLSGLTQFPHVHFAVRLNGQVVDPFRPGPVDGCTRCATEDLWTNTPEYVDAELLNIGFSDAIPKFDAIKAGEANLPTLLPSTPALVTWVHGMGKVPGDTLTLTLRAPDGTVLAENTKTFDRAQAVYFEAVGVRRRANWSMGQYIGEAVLRRDGREIARRRAEIPSP